MREAKVYNDGKWVDPCDKIIMHKFFIDKNGIYELKLQVEEKIIVLRSDDKVYCEKCDRSDPKHCPKGKVWCNELGRYMDKDGYCSFGDEKGENK